MMAESPKKLSELELKDWSREPAGLFPCHLNRMGSWICSSSPVGTLQPCYWEIHPVLGRKWPRIRWFEKVFSKGRV